MSPRTFMRQVKAQFNTTPAREVQLLGVEAAMQHLEDSRTSPSKIAHIAGFRDEQGPRRALLQRVGLTLKQYRERFSELDRSRALRPERAAKASPTLGQIHRTFESDRKCISGREGLTPLTRRGGAFVGRTRPGRSLVERPRSSLVSRRFRTGVACLTLDLIRRSGRIAGLFFNPKLDGVVGVRLATALEFPRRCQIDLFVNPRRTNARPDKQGSGNLWEGGKGVLDVRVSQC
jgi:Helix-turn-helix domain